jgi:hypothetical protein
MIARCQALSSLPRAAATQLSGMTFEAVLDAPSNANDEHRDLSNELRFNSSR